jgi:hypothetical protein
MIQIRQPKHSATVIRLDSLFAHGDGLQCRRPWDDGDRMGDSTKGGGRRSFERYRLFLSIASFYSMCGLRNAALKRSVWVDSSACW